MYCVLPNSWNQLLLLLLWLDRRSLSISPGVTPSLLGNVPRILPYANLTRLGKAAWRNLKSVNRIKFRNLTKLIKNRNDDQGDIRFRMTDDYLELEY